MQDGMRSYFDELSSQKHFIGIQQVLVEEINNSDSKKYAILTTTDSFYRYKEAVKELISEILNENDEKKAVLLKEKNSLETGTNSLSRKPFLQSVRWPASITFCRRASVRKITSSN